MNKSDEIISTPSALLDFEAAEMVDGDVETRTLVFGAAHHNQRIDRALVDLVPEFSRSYLQQLIDLGGVCIDGKVVAKASQRVKMADRGSVELRPTPQSQSFKAEQLKLDMVFQDEHLLVINKPAGMVVHPAPGNWSGTLMNGLLGFDPQAFMMPRAGIVHRLDKDTSGLMVVARTREVMESWCEPSPRGRSSVSTLPWHMVPGSAEGSDRSICRWAGIRAIDCAWQR